MRWLFLLSIGALLALSIHVFASSEVIYGVFPAHYDYEITKSYKIGTFQNDAIYVSRAEAGSLSPERSLGEKTELFKRIQIEDEYGNVFAYTPTRMTAIPFCPFLDLCLVFMWKTVYPYPAIFKLDSRTENWGRLNNPPMHYSRRGNDGVAFKDVTNLLLGTFGVFLFMKENIAYFSITILLSILLCLQITKYTELAEHQKKIIKQILSILLIKISPWIPVEPFMLTSVMICYLSWYAVDAYGIPFSLSVAVVIVTFMISSYRVGKLRAAKAKGLT